MQAERIALKIQWDKDVRRVTVDKTTTFKDLQQTLRSIFKAVPEKRWKTTVMKYKDDEGDLCTITTDEELQEAISLCGAAEQQSARPLLRLVLVTKNAPKAPVEQPTTTTTPCQPPQVEFFKTLFGGGDEDIKQFISHVTQHLQQFQQTAQQPAQEHETQSISENEAVHPYPHPFPSRFGCGPHPGFGHHPHPHFGGHHHPGPHGHHGPHPHGPFGGHHGHHGHGHGRFHYLRTKSQHLHEQAIQLMEAKDYSGARALFQQQLEILHRPWHRATPLYNIACCDALTGDSASALSHLEQAITCGFTDVEHILNDEDLTSLRGTEAFEALISKAKEGVPQPSHCVRPPCHGGAFQQKHQEWFDLQQKALNLMAVGTVDAVCNARELLSLQASLSPHPWHQRIPLYNMACCDALLGKTEEALNHLKEAIAAGYRNLKHMETDEDLKSLRETEEWQALVNGLKSGHHSCRGWWRKFRGMEEEEQQQQEQETEPQQEEQQPQEPEVAVVIEQREEAELPELVVAVEEEASALPAAVEEAFNSEYSTLLDVLTAMGFTDVEENLAALARAGGDLGRALDLLI